MSFPCPTCIAQSHIGICPHNREHNTLPKKISIEEAFEFTIKMFQEQTRELEAERTKNARLVEALKFYASGEHMEADDYDTETMDQTDFDLHEYRYGKVAREALAAASKAEQKEND